MLAHVAATTHPRDYERAANNVSALQLAASLGTRFGSAP